MSEHEHIQQALLELLQEPDLDEVSHDQFILLLTHLTTMECSDEERGELANLLYKSAARWGETDRLLFILEEVLRQSLHMPDRLSFKLRYYCGILYYMSKEMEQARSCFVLLQQDLERSSEHDYLSFLVSSRLFFMSTELDDRALAQSSLDQMYSTEPQKQVAYVKMRRSLMKALFMSDFELDAEQSHSLLNEAMRYAKIHIKLVPTDGFAIYPVLLSRAWLLAREGRFQDLLYFGRSHDWAYDTDRIYQLSYQATAHIILGHEPMWPETLYEAVALSQNVDLPDVALYLRLFQVWAAFLFRDVSAIERSLGELLSTSLAMKNHESSMAFGYLLQAISCGEALSLAEVGQTSDYEERALSIMTRWVRGEPTEALERLPHPLVRACHVFVTRHDSPLLLEGERGELLYVDDEPCKDLSGRPALLKILHGVMREGPDYLWSTVELFEVGWSIDEGVSENGFRRVYTELHRLKKMGVEVRSEADGYRFPRHIVWLSDVLPRA